MYGIIFNHPRYGVSAIVNLLPELGLAEIEPLSGPVLPTGGREWAVVPIGEVA
jgi:hypothetical protein